MGMSQHKDGRLEVSILNIKVFLLIKSVYRFYTVRFEQSQDVFNVTNVILNFNTLIYSSPTAKFVNAQKPNS